MYKLVVVGGKKRGEEFHLQEGENIIGRDGSCSVPIDLEGISKKHLKITVNKESVYLEDLGSSNGTFLNEKMIKTSPAKNGDRIALPNMILQLVFLKEIEIIVRKKVQKSSDKDVDLDFATPPAPANFVEKILHLIRYKIVPFILGINKEYEWRSVLAIILSTYLVIVIGVTIFPILQENRRVLLMEVSKRGVHYAKEVARLNANYLASRQLDAIDTTFLDSEDGVDSYELFDMEGRIIRPLSRMNDYINDTFSVYAQKKITEGNIQLGQKELDNGTFGIFMAVMGRNVRLGSYEPVGMVAIKFSPPSLMVEAKNNSGAYLKALVICFTIGLIFFFIIYYMTIFHLEDLQKQIDQVMRGRKKEIESKFMFIEMNPLKTSVNIILHKLKEDEGGEGSDFGEIESDEKYVATLYEFFEGAAGATIVLNSDKLIKKINIQAEDLTGIRQNIGEGMGLLDVTKDQGLAATMIDLCDQSANNGGVAQKGSYEIQGREYNIIATSLMGKDGFAKAFYLTFILDE